MVGSQRVNPFSLSHPMGEGRGEGCLVIHFRDSPLLGIQ